MVTRPTARQLDYQDSPRGRGRGFSPLEKIQNELEPYANSYKTDPEVFSRVKSGRCLKLTTSVYLVSKIRTCGDIWLIPHTSYTTKHN